MSNTATQHALSPVLFDHSSTRLNEASQVLSRLEDEAVEAQIIALSDLPLEEHLVWALAALSAERWPLLTTLSLSLLERAPTDDGALALLALSLFERGEAEEAQVVIERAFEYVSATHPRFEALCALSERLQEELDSSLNTLNLSAPSAWGEEEGLATIQERGPLLQPTEGGLPLDLPTLTDQPMEGPTPLTLNAHELEEFVEELEEFGEDELTSTLSRTAAKRVAQPTSAADRLARSATAHTKLPSLESSPPSLSTPPLTERESLPPPPVQRLPPLSFTPSQPPKLPPVPASRTAPPMTPPAPALTPPALPPAPSPESSALAPEPPHEPPSTAPLDRALLLRELELDAQRASERKAQRATLFEQEAPSSQASTPQANTPQATSSSQSASSLSSSSEAPQQRGLRAWVWLTSLCALIGALGALIVDHQGRVVSAMSASEALSYQGYQELSAELSELRGGAHWVAATLNAQLPLRWRGRGEGELTPVSAWVEVTNWVIFGFDERQTLALVLLERALTERPTSPYSRAALSLTLSALSAPEAARAVSDQLSTRSWLRGLSKAVSAWREGGLRSVIEGARESERLNPSATFTQQLLLRAFEINPSQLTWEQSKREARFGLSDQPFLWRSERLSESEREALLKGSPRLLSWWLERQLASSPSDRDPAFDEVIKAVLKEPVLPATLLSPLLSLARERLDESLLMRLSKALSEAEGEARLTVSESAALSASLELIFPQHQRRSGESERAARERLRGLLPLIVQSTPQLTPERLNPQLSASHVRLLEVNLEQALYQRRWRVLRAYVTRAQQLTPHSTLLHTLNTLSLALERRSLKALAPLARSVPPEPSVFASLERRLPTSLLLLEGLKVLKAPLRAQRLALSLRLSPSFTPEVSLSLALSLCEGHELAPSLGAQWVACEGALSRAPWHHETLLAHALLLEELGASQQAYQALKRLETEGGRVASSPLSARLALRASSLEALKSAQPTSPELQRYQEALIKLAERRPHEALKSLEGLRGLSRGERARRARLSALLSLSPERLDPVVALGSPSATLQRWVMSLGEGASASLRPRLITEGALSSTHLARLDSLTAVVACFHEAGAFDAHHYAPPAKWSRPLNTTPPPASCRDAFHHALGQEREALTLPSYALNIAAALYLSVGQLKSAELMWAEAERRDPLSALEAQLARGLAQHRLGRARSAAQLWAPFLGTPSPLRDALTSLR